MRVLIWACTTALTMYGIALAVAAGAVFSPADAAWRFAAAIVIGCVFGLAVGWVIARIRAAIEDTPVERRAG